MASIRPTISPHVNNNNNKKQEPNKIITKNERAQVWIPPQEKGKAVYTESGVKVKLDEVQAKKALTPRPAAQRFSSHKHVNTRETPMPAKEAPWKSFSERKRLALTHRELTRTRARSTHRKVRRSLSNKREQNREGCSVHHPARIVFRKVSSRAGRAWKVYYPYYKKPIKPFLKRRKRLTARKFVFEAKERVEENIRIEVFPHLRKYLRKRKLLALKARISVKNLDSNQRFPSRRDHASRKLPLSPKGIATKEKINKEGAISDEQRQLVEQPVDRSATSPSSPKFAIIRKITRRVPALPRFSSMGATKGQSSRIPLLLSKIAKAKPVILNRRRIAKMQLNEANRKVRWDFTKRRLLPWKRRYMEKTKASQTRTLARAIAWRTERTQKNWPTQRYYVKGNRAELNKSLVRLGSAEKRSKVRQGFAQQFSQTAASSSLLPALAREQASIYSPRPRRYRKLQRRVRYHVRSRRDWRRHRMVHYKKLKALAKFMKFSMERARKPRKFRPGKPYHKVKKWNNNKRPFKKGRRAPRRKPPSKRALLLLKKRKLKGALKKNKKRIAIRKRRVLPTKKRRRLLKIVRKKLRARHKKKTRKIIRGKAWLKRRKRKLLAKLRLLRRKLRRRKLRRRRREFRARKRNSPRRNKRRFYKTKRMPWKKKRKLRLRIKTVNRIIGWKKRLLRISNKLKAKRVSSLLIKDLTQLRQRFYKEAHKPNRRARAAKSKFLRKKKPHYLPRGKVRRRFTNAAVRFLRNRRLHAYHLSRHLMAELPRLRQRVLIAFLKDCARHGREVTRTNAIRYLNSSEVSAKPIRSACRHSSRLLSRTLLTRWERQGRAGQLRATPRRAILRNILRLPEKITHDRNPIILPLRNLASAISWPARCETGVKLLNKSRIALANVAIERREWKVQLEAQKTSRAPTFYLHNVKAKEGRIQLQAKRLSLVRQHRLKRLPKWRRPGRTVKLPERLSTEVNTFDRTRLHRPTSIATKRKTLLPPNYIWTLGQMQRRLPFEVEKGKLPLYRPLHPSRGAAPMPRKRADRLLLEAATYRKRTRREEKRNWRKRLSYPQVRKRVRRIARIRRRLTQRLRRRSKKLTKLADALIKLTPQRLSRIRERLLMKGIVRSEELIRYTLLRTIRTVARAIRARRRISRTISRMQRNIPRGTSTRIHGLRNPLKGALAKKEYALWHAKAAIRARQKDRQYTPWTKQYRLEWRRSYVPRLDGVARSRGWATRKIYRERALIDEALSYRKLPAKQYPDLAYILLQQGKGTPAAVGYERFRRSFRAHTANNRWWHPVNYALPIPVPTSRFAVGDQLREKVRVRRVIPLRHTRDTTPYLKPLSTEKGLPATINVRALSVNKQVHEATMQQARVWEKGRWKTLDPLFTPTEQELVKLVPTAYWSRLAAVSPLAQATVIARVRESNVEPKERASFLRHSIDRVLKLSSNRRAERLARREETKEARKWNRVWHWNARPALVKEDVSMLTKDGGYGLYKRWLHGAQGYLKRLPITYLAPGKGKALRLEKDRVRFPASGYRRGSFDRTIHAFVKRLAPSRLRRVLRSNFKQRRPKLHTFYKYNIARFELTRMLRSRRNRLRGYARVRYLSRSYRELARTQSKILPRSPVKRRFLSLPLKTVFTADRRIKQKARRDTPMRTYRAGLLRQALRNRMIERRFIDLKEQLYRRRILREKVLPPWILSKRERRRNFVHTHGRWHRFGFSHRQHKRSFWTIWDNNFLHLRRARRARKTRMHTADGLPLLPQRTPKQLKALSRSLTPVIKIARKVLPFMKYKRRRRIAALMQELDAVEYKHLRWSIKAKLGGYSYLPERVEKRSWRSRLRVARRLKTRGASAFAISTLAQRARKALLKAAYLRARLAGRNSNSSSIAQVIAQEVRPVDLWLFIQRKKHRRLLRWRPFIKSRIKYWTLRKNDRNPSTFGRELDRMMDGIKKCKRRLSRVKENSITSFLTAKLVKHATKLSRIAPVFFQKPTNIIIKTEAMEKHEQEWKIASKEERYKLTAQYVEAITQQFPALIRKYIHQNLKNVAFRVAKGLTKALYWSLRLKIAVDMRETLLNKRDVSGRRLALLAEELDDNSSLQTSTHPYRVSLRNRLQPGRLIRARSSDRFRFDWLRSFFPRKHAVFLEDSLDYRGIPVSTNLIRHVMPTPKKLETTPKTKPIERSTRQILSMKYSINAPRFETLLQSERRLPSLEKTEIYYKAEPTSFFRNFSTHSRNAQYVSEFLEKQRRLMSEEETVSVFESISVRDRSKIRTERKGRTNFAVEKKEMAMGSTMDPRFLRQKSIRSQQAFIRRPKGSVTLVELNNSTPASTMHTTRRHVFQPARSEAPLVQVATQLRVEQIWKDKTKTLDEVRKELLKPFEKRKPIQKTHGKGFIATSKRSILSFRRASNRLRMLPNTSRLAIPPATFCCLNFVKEKEPRD